MLHGQPSHSGPISFSSSSRSGPASSSSMSAAVISSWSRPQASRKISLLYRSDGSRMTASRASSERAVNCEPVRTASTAYSPTISSPRRYSWVCPSGGVISTSANFISFLSLTLGHTRRRIECAPANTSDRQTDSETDTEKGEFACRRELLSTDSYTIKDLIGCQVFLCGLFDPGGDQRIVLKRTSGRDIFGVASDMSIRKWPTSSDLLFLRVFRGFLGGVISSDAGSS